MHFTQTESSFFKWIGFQFRHCWHPGLNNSLLWGGCAVHWRVFSSISNFYQLEANSTSAPFVTTKNVSWYCQISEGWGNSPGLKISGLKKTKIVPSNSKMRKSSSVFFFFFSSSVFLRKNEGNFIIWKQYRCYKNLTSRITTLYYWIILKKNSNNKAETHNLF